MREQTPTQAASAAMAKAVFADPDLRARFEIMVKETDAREPVRDDFAWVREAVIDERVKIDMDPEEALRVLLSTPSKKRGER